MRKKVCDEKSCDEKIITGKNVRWKMWALL